MNFSQNNFSAIKKSFDWLDNDQDGKISISDIQTSFNIQESEAMSLFESLSTSGNSYIEFEEFSQGLLNFPSLMQQFQDDLSPKISTHIPYSFSLQSNTEEDILESFFSQNEYLSNFSKQSLISLAHSLANYAQSLKTQLSETNDRIISQNLEFRLQCETISDEKSRIEKNYEDLLSEQLIFEKNFKDIEENFFKSECEARENRLKISALQKENQESLKKIKKLESIILDKDKHIQDLRKKISTKSNLVALETSCNSNRPRCNSAQSCKTPKGTTKTFEFYEYPENYNVKAQLIKNLKTQLNQKTFECEKLDKKLAQLSNEKVELLEKVKLLSAQKVVTEEDEETKSEAINSLRDELFRIDPVFSQGNRFSLLAGKMVKDIGLQVNFKRDLRVERQKKRDWCFSIFRS